MTLYNRYILIMALTFSITVLALAISAVADIGLCITIYVIESLILTELFIYLNPRAKSNLSRVNILLFALFLMLVVVKVIEILLGITLLS